tara:strand:- start:2992 stop:3585 length:594 start_codon:yes stop_codon:yes gene_type:complete
MGTNLLNALIFITQTIGGLYLMFVLMRLLMQISRVDYYNPISQGIIKLTDPLCAPIRRFLPFLWRIDTATLLLAIILQLIIICLVMKLSGGLVFDLIYVAWALVGLSALACDIYFFALLISVVVSWLAPHSNHPAIVLINELTNPICEPARKIIPPLGGLDFSIIIVFMAITLIDQYLLIKPLAVSLGIPRGLILGL